MSIFYIVEQNARSIAGHYFNYTKAIAKAAVEQGYDVTILCNIDFNEDYGLENVTVVRTFPNDWIESEWKPVKYWMTGNFSFDICNALYETDATDEDIVFVHTLGNVELKSLLRYFLSKSPKLINIKFHVLLRYDPEVIFASFPEYRDYFRRLSTSPTAKRNLIFHSDTDRLAAHYSTISNMHFNVAPIPFQQAPLLDILNNNETKSRSDSVINVTYVGDARREKNYHYLPDAVATILSDELIEPQVNFTLQSNFNCEGGEEGMAGARHQLEQFDDDRVKLLFSQLSSEEYYGLICDGDAILLPYSAKNYSNRSSGILIEAMAAGKPVLVSKGSWMESQVDDTHSVIIQSPDKIGDAIKELAANFSSLQQGALAKQKKALEFSSPDTFMQHLKRTEMENDSGFAEDAPHVLVIFEGGRYMSPDGSRCIFTSQLDYLSNAGYKITVLFLFDDYESMQMRPIIIEHLNKIIEPYKVFNVLSAFPGSMSHDLARTAHGEIWNGAKFSIKFDIEQSKKFDFSSETIQHLNKHRPDVILLNYVTRYPVIQALGLEDVRTVCETIDIQSYQKAIAGNRNFGSRDWEEECKYLAECDSIISLNDTETDKMHEKLPDMPIVTTGCFPGYKRTSYLDLLGIANAAELIAACGSLRNDLSWNSVILENSAIVQNLLRPSKIDMVFISTNHPPNRSGLKKFLEETYIPHLKPLGINLFIAGGVDYPRLSKKMAHMPDVYYTGPIDNLAPLYSAAKIVILPIYEGAGRAVKTAEAYSRGMPVVATPMALRGQDYENDSIACANNSTEFSEHIQRLVFDLDERAKAAKASHECFKKYSSPSSYTAKMKEVFKPLKDIKEIHLDDEANITEVNPSVYKFNRMMIAWIQGHRINLEQIRDLELDQNVTSEMIAAYRQVISGEVSIYDVPMFYSHPTMGKTIANMQLRENSIEKYDEFAKLIMSQFK